MPNDERQQPGRDVARGSSGGETPGSQGANDADRYGLSNLAIVFSTIAGTLAHLGRDLSRTDESSLIDRAVALDRVMKSAQVAIGDTRRLLSNCVAQAIARGNVDE